MRQYFERTEIIMKKLLAALLVFAVASVSFAACSTSNEPGNDSDINSQENNQENNSETDDKNSDGNTEETPEQTEDTVVRLAGLKGPTSMGLVNLLASDEAGTSKNDYEFTIAATADEINPLLIKGELDVAAIPANLASVLYNNTDGNIQILAVNTLGVIYIVEKGVDISDISDLAGKTIYATGKGSTPEYALRYILEQNGIDPDNDVTIEFKSEPAEIVALLSENGSGVAMLPQPYVTVAETTVEGLKTVIDLNSEWDKLDTGSKLVTGVVVARKEFAENYPQTIKNFLDEYEESAELALTDVDGTAELVEKYGIVKAAVAKKALPYCNIKFMRGEEMKKAVSGYLTILSNQDIKAIGGKLPEDDFYYIAE